MLCVCMSVSTQVLQSGMAVRPEQAATPLGPAHPRPRGRGRRRKNAHRSAAGEQQQVLIDGQFDVPVEEPPIGVTVSALPQAPSSSSSSSVGEPVVTVDKVGVVAREAQLELSGERWHKPLSVTVWINQDEVRPTTVLGLGVARPNHASQTEEVSRGAEQAQPEVCSDSVAPLAPHDVATRGKAGTSQAGQIEATPCAGEEEAGSGSSPQLSAAARPAPPLSAGGLVAGAGGGSGTAAGSTSTGRDAGERGGRQASEGARQARRARQKEPAGAAGSLATRQSARKSTPLKAFTVRHLGSSAPRPSVRQEEVESRANRSREDRTDPCPSPPPAKRTRRALATAAAAAAAESKEEVERLGQEGVGPDKKEAEPGKQSPLEWSVDEVAEFVGRGPNCGHMVEVFKNHVRKGGGREGWEGERDSLSCVSPRQEVDGESLLSLDPEMLVKLMGFKTGPALRLHRRILALKRQFGMS